MSERSSIAPILLLAPRAMLGRAWRELLDAHGLAYETAARPALDLTLPAKLDAVVTDRFRTVINCAAWTDVDGAEENEAQATAVNGEGVGRLADACRRAGATLVHYSTDYVFNGRAAVPYRVDQPRDPVNAYGRTKARGEELIEASACRHLLIRTSWLYAPWGKNFVRTMARLTAEKDRLRVVDDQRGRPTSCAHLARTSLALLERGVTGTWHATDGGECTWFELTRAINGHLGHDCDVQPCTSAEFPRSAKRPGYSVLNLSRSEAILGPMPQWKANLADVLDTMSALTNPNSSKSS